MSIMSDTYLVKSGGDYTLYRAGCFSFPDEFIDEAKRRNISVYDLFQQLFDPKYNSYWGKPTSGISENEVVEIADSDHSVDDGKAGYHRFAGDAVYLIDKDEKRVCYRTRTIRPARSENESYLLPGSWKELSTTKE